MIPQSLPSYSDWDSCDPISWLVVSVPLVRVSTRADSLLGWRSISDASVYWSSLLFSQLTTKFGAAPLDIVPMAGRSGISRNVQTTNIYRKHIYIMNLSCNPISKLHHFHSLPKAVRGAINCYWPVIQRAALRHWNQRQSGCLKQYKSLSSSREMKTLCTLVFIRFPSRQIHSYSQPK